VARIHASQNAEAGLRQAFARDVAFGGSEARAPQDPSELTEGSCGESWGGARVALQRTPNRALTSFLVLTYTADLARERIRPITRAPAPLMEWVQKMGRFPWQELDEVGDLGRFPVKKRRSLMFTFGLLAERASSARFSHATARRLGPRTAASGVIDSRGNSERHAVARFRRHLAFPARDRRNVRHCGRNVRNLASACCRR
jgi:hypothetical protein